MGTFKSKKTFFASPALIPEIAKDITVAFADDGYEVKSQDLVSGGYDLSITKGGVFKAVLGMKTALKVNIYPDGNAIKIEAGVGIFGQQAVPTIISAFFFWPVLITQISGIITQSKMDDRVMEIANNTIARAAYSQPYQRPSGNDVPQPSKGVFCTACGKQNPAESSFCCQCGAKL